MNKVEKGSGNNLSRRKAEGYGKVINKKINKAITIISLLVLINIIISILVVNTNWFIRYGEDKGEGINYKTPGIEDLGDIAQKGLKLMNIRYNGYTNKSSKELYGTLTEDSAKKIEKAFMESVHKNGKKIDITNEVKPYIDKGWEVYPSGYTLRSSGKSKDKKYYILTSYDEREYKYSKDSGDSLEIDIVAESKKDREYKILKVSLLDKGIGNIDDTYKDERYKFEIDEYALYGKSLLRITCKNKDDERVNLDVYISDKGDLEIKNIEPVVSFKFSS